MTKRRPLLLFITALTIIAGSYSWSAFRHQAAGRATVLLGLDEPVPPMKTTDELIAFWRDRYDQDPQDFISLTYLGQAFIRKGRETGDATVYEKAETALRKSFEIVPDDETTLAFLSATSFAKHDFKNALSLANRILAVHPQSLSPLATIGDAQLELGNYREAETAYEQLIALKPGPAVYSRVARLKWLQGQPDEAIERMQAAVDSTQNLGLSGENVAWYRYQLGELYFNVGKLDQTEKLFNSALNSFNNYYLALAGLGKVRAAQGRYAEAIEFYKRAVAIIPQPDFIAALGDLYAINGQTAEAGKQYETVEFIGNLNKMNQVIYNRQLALFDSNHDRNLRDALDLAVRELTERKDIYGYDALAWTLCKNGRLVEASTAITKAMQLGTEDALLYYHAGMIAKGLGRTGDAQTLLRKALSINPHFDALQASFAKQALRNSE